MFGKNFSIFEQYREVLLKLCNYYIKDPLNCKKLDIELKKSILLSGPVGWGKSSLMN